MATSKGIVAGKKFIEIAAQEKWGPQLQEMHRRLQPVWNALFKAECAKIKRDNDAEIQRLAAKVRVEFEQMAAAWEENYGEPYPQTIADWKRQARRAGVSAQDILDGELTPRGLEPIIEGYLLELADKRLVALDTNRKETVNTASGQADTKADNEKKSEIFLPENRDVIKLDMLIKSEQNAGRKKIEIAREFTDSDEKTANNLLRQIRRYKEDLNKINPSQF